MMTGKCVHCANGYHKQQADPCYKCKNNPYLNTRQSEKLYDYFEIGDKPEMQVQDAEVWR